MSPAARVVEELRGLTVVPQQEIELSVPVVVEDREATAVLDAVGRVDEGDVGEGAVAVVAVECATAGEPIEDLLRPLPDGGREVAEVNPR